MATNPKYTYGPEAGNDVNPTDPEKHILMQIAANTSPLNGSGGGSVGLVLGGKEETRTLTKEDATDDYTIPAGALSYTILYSLDFVGTTLGLAVSGADTAQDRDNASPGNTLPAIAITRSAGTYSVIEGR